MAELNHRVKNNLLMLESLISLKDDGMGASADLSDIARHVRAVSLVHELLQAGGNAQEVPIAVYMGDLLSVVFSQWSGAPIEVESRVDEMSLSTQKTVALGIIVNELATNAMKHGFADEDAPRFDLSLTVDDPGGEYVMIVGNNGAPIPDDVDIDTAPSLGLRLVTALTDQIKGKLEILRAPEPRFTFTFPASKD